MARPVCSVVLATYNRGHLLRRSLACYAEQEFPKKDFELVVIDDHSTDDTKQMVLDWSASTGINTVYLVPSPKLTDWRDCGAILNNGIRASSGDFILLTHPEVMPGRNSVSECVDILSASYQQLLYACCKPYYLSRRDQERIDTVPWLEEGPLAVRKIKGFYDLEQQIGQHPDYTPQSVEAVGKIGYHHKHWLSWVFGGCSRPTWKKLGGMLETSRWGSVDVGFMHRRRTVGIANHTCIDDSTLCVHQNHSGPNDVPTPRVEESWKEELKSLDLNDPVKMTYPHCDYLGWG